MINNNAEFLSRGMKILTEQMGFVDAETFMFLIKTEDFDYTKWQREYFTHKTAEQIDSEMDAYFSKHPFAGDPKKII